VVRYDLSAREEGRRFVLLGVVSVHLVWLFKEGCVMLWKTVWTFFASESGYASRRAGLSLGWLVVMVVAVTLLAAPQVARADTCSDCGIDLGSCAWIHPYGTICFGSESWCLWEYWCNSPSEGCVMEPGDWECRYSAQGCDWGC